MRKRTANKIVKRHNLETEYRKSTLLNAIKKTGLLQECIASDNNYITIKGII